jgi:hypothetical protein
MLFVSTGSHLVAILPGVTGNVTDPASGRYGGWGSAGLLQFYSSGHHLFRPVVLNLSLRLCPFVTLVKAALAMVGYAWPLLLLPTAYIFFCSDSQLFLAMWTSEVR